MIHPEAPPAGAAGTRAEVFAWAMYDWANSAYSTLSITVIAIYMQRVVLPGKWGAVAYGAAIAVGTLGGAVLSPLVGALADVNRSKRRWLAGTAMGGVAAAVLMALAPPDVPWLVIVLFLAMHMLFEISYVPYNGFLPEIADERAMNRVSALGYALGYVGGGLALLLAMPVIYYGGPRWGIFLLGVWWGVFTLPTLWTLRDRMPRPDRPDPIHRAAAKAFRQVGRTLRSIRSYRILAIFLVAYLLYNDGMQTILTQASTFAIRDLKFSEDDPTELLRLILMIQFVALPGALLVGWCADRFGQKQTLIGCLVVLLAICCTAWVVRTKSQFWIMGGVFALVMGGTQSVSRAIMGLMTPPERSAEFMGFFSFSGKATSFLGVGLFTLIVALTDSARPAVFAPLVFFLVGWWLVARINVKEGRREALEA